MNKPKDISVIASGTLKKSGGSYDLIPLSSEHIDDILALQDIIIATLGEGEQGFIIKKDHAFFEKHFANGNIVLGVVHDGKLIAQSVIVHPTNENPKTGMTDMLMEADVDDITIIQGVIVHPDFQGNRLMTVMVDAWLDIAEKAGRHHAVAEVAANNFYSWSVFIKEGLAIHSIGEDPSDGIKLYNFHADVTPLIQHRLKPAFNKSAKKTAPMADLAAQKKLLDKGYLGTAFNRASKEIEFEKPKKKAAGLKRKLP